MEKTIIDKARRLIKKQSETEREKAQRIKELNQALKLLTKASKSINEDNSEKIRYLLEDCSQGFVDMWWFMIGL